MANDSHAEGYGTTAASIASHTEGSQTCTRGSAEGGHAEGIFTVVVGRAGHAEGGQTQALHDYSHAGGYGTCTGAQCQTVIGIYNDEKSDTLFEVGNGTGEIHRNAFEVYNDGDIGICKDGKIYSLHKILATYFTDANLKQ